MKARRQKSHDSGGGDHDHEPLDDVVDDAAEDDREKEDGDQQVSPEQPLCIRRPSPREMRQSHQRGGGGGRIAPEPQIDGNEHDPQEDGVEAPDSPKATEHRFPGRSGVARDLNRYGVLKCAGGEQQTY
jgi:hypothetical protein